MSITLMNNAGGNCHNLNEIVDVFATSGFKCNYYRGETFRSSGGVLPLKASTGRGSDAMVDGGGTARVSCLCRVNQCVIDRVTIYL